MNYSILWHTPIILPTLPTSKATRQAEPTSSDLDSHLPRWERLPQGRSGRETGDLDPEWIRRHLP